jgi:glycosyltransferase involved in cell wall biosynthesis
MGRISTLITCKNQAAALEKTLESVFAQNYPNHEIILVVAGDSSDESLQVARKYVDKLILLEDDGSGGPELALCMAMQRASGDIISWLGSGDLLLPGALGIVAKYFVDHPYGMILNGNAIILNNDFEKILDVPMFPIKLEHILYGGFTICAESTFFKRELLNKAGAYLEHIRASDYELWLRLYSIAPPETIGFTNHKLTAFHLHEGQNSSEKTIYTAEMVDCRDEYFVKAGISREAARENIAKWVNDLEIMLKKRSKELRQPYIYIPYYQGWFSGWPFTDDCKFEVPKEPDLLLELLPKVIEKLKAEEVKKIVIYGSGKHTGRLIDSDMLQQAGIEICGILDDNPSSQNKSFSRMNYKLLKTEYFSQFNFDGILISSDVYEEKMYRELTDLSVDNIYRIYGDRLKWKV